MAVKLFTFGDVKIKVYEKREEVENSDLQGCRSICGEMAIELIGSCFKPCEKEWSFCHLIKQINDEYFIILNQVV